MAGWLSRIDLLPSEFLEADDLNYLGQDIRVWGGDVNGGGHRLSNVILDGVTIPPGTSNVVSVFGRTGAVVAVATDYTPAFIGAVPVARQVIAGAGLSGGGALSADVTLTAKVTSVFGRSNGAIVATAGDYAASQVTNAVDASQSYLNPSWLSSLAWGKLTGVPSFVPTSTQIIAGPGLSGGGPLNANVTLSAPVMVGSGASHAAGIVPDPGATAGSGRYLCENGSWAVPPGSGGGAVSSVFGRTGAVLAVSTDYSSYYAPAGVVFGASGASHAVGLVPDPGAVAGAARYLCENGTWTAPPVTGSTYWLPGNAGAIYYSTGNVGVYNSAPSNALSIGTDLGVTGVPLNSIAVGNSASDSVVTVGQSNTVRGRMVWKYNATPANAYMAIGAAQPPYNPLVLQDAGGNVGIGTTNPQCLLDVSGAINTPLIRLNATYGAVGNYCDLGWGNPAGVNPVSGIRGRASAGGQMAFDFILQTGGSASLAAGVNVMTIVGSGNVGIGTTSPASVLEVAGMIRSTALVTPTSGAGVEIAYDGTSIGYINAYDRTGAAFKALYVHGAPLCLNNLGGGNVGIGMNSPSFPLDVLVVNSGVRVYSNSTAQFAFFYAHNTAVPSGLILGMENSAGGNLGAGTSPYAGVVSTNYSYPLQFGSGNTVRMTLTASGSLGIGTTAPESLFAVHGSHSNAALNSSAGSIATFQSDTTVQMQFGAITGSSYAAWIQVKVDAQNASYPLVFQPAGGLVGVGLYTPWAAFTHQGSAAYAPSLTFATAATSTHSIQVANGVELAMSQDSASPYGWWLQARGSGNGAYPILLNPMGGVVGIGTRTPSYALHIVGDCNITGTYRVNGTAISAGNINAYNNGTLVNSTPGLDFINSTGSSASVSWTTGPPARCTVQFTYTSDERTKRNIEDLAGGISIIEKLRPVSFEFNGLANTTDGRKFIGVIAQELREVIPTAVGTYRTRLRPDDADEQELLDIDPHQITAHLILAVQQLRKRITELESKLERN